MKDQETMRVGVVVERRRIDHPWQDYAWRPVAVIPGAPAAEGWPVLYRDDRCTRYLAGTLGIELFPKETEDYGYNLSQRVPVVYVVLRRNEGAGEHPFKAFRATICPSEARDRLESGEDIVEGVAMPEAIAAWVRDYIARHPAEASFQKRRRKSRDSAPAAGGARGSGRG